MSTPPNPTKPLTPIRHRRLAQLQALSRHGVQAQWAARALAEQSMEARLAQLPAREPLTCSPGTPLRQALQQMQQRRVGSVVVVDEAQAPQGILTRHDILERVTLLQRHLDTPISAVMSAPVHVLDASHTLQDAALLMARHGLRHVPVVQGGRLVNIVSERDLFALQRQSLQQLGSGLRAAADLPALQQLAEGIRRLAAQLLGQGVQARQLTELISHLNDLLTARLVELVAQRRGADLSRACWLAFGSEGRGEQTVATDQDNGLAFLSDDPNRDRPAWLALAAEVNEGLAACGYPLCPGNVMARNPACCLSVPEWRARFQHWIGHGAPQDLLHASIYFDLRPLCGQAAIVEPLRQVLASGPARVPRFIKQLADNALQHGPPLNWRGALHTHEVQGHALIDLKLQGTAMFVDAARLYALAHGVPEVGTRARLEAVAPRLQVPAAEAEAWVSAFEFLQMLRLQVQLGARGPAANPNEIDVRGLHDIDRRMLQESMRVAGRLQQRVALDYRR